MVKSSEYDRATLVANHGELQQIDDDEPITLAEACRLFPRAKLTPSTLRAEADRERLDIFRLGKRDYTTMQSMREMVRKCREESRRRSPCISTTADSGGQARSAAALSQITSALKRSV